MISLLQLYPEHLDLNGDGGNLLVLQRRLEWGGVPVSRLQYRTGNSLEGRPDVVLIGHGSSEAWRQIYGDFARLVPTLETWMHSGTQVLAIASGFAALHGLVDGLASNVDRADRRSEFIFENFGQSKLAGYLNSELQLPNLVIDGNLTGSMLHGPLLAKNSWLADSLIEKVLPKGLLFQAAENKFEFVQSLEKSAVALAEEQAQR